MKEYWHLKAVLTLSARDEEKEQVEVAPPNEVPLFEFEDLAIYQTHITVAGKRREISEIANVDGTGVDLRLNLLSYVKDSSLRISFRDGGSYELREQRSAGGRNRHEAINKATQLLKKLTFRPLFDALVSDVRKGPVQIGTTNEASIDSVLGLLLKLLLRRKFPPIYLRRDGTITNGPLILDLKQCRREGMLELGIRRANLSEPESIYASHRKTRIERSNRSALRFSVNAGYRADVVMALLDWVATANNEL